FLQHALADCTLPSASALVHVAIYAQWTFTTKLSPMSGVPRKNGLADSESARPFSMDRAVATEWQQVKHLQTTCGTE
ncbi:MAG: hypothetical protein LKF50_05545, partial [Solobacterium sp.]|nr:hypothetical protein [Solobacterium sp.]